MLSDTKVVVRGAGDLATGVIYNLYQAGFQVVATEVEEPLVVRRTVSLAEAVYQGEYKVENIIAKKTEDFDKIEKILERSQVPVIVDPKAEIINYFKPDVVVDAIMAKKNLGTQINDAEIVIGLGPGFTAKKDVDAVIETARGHDLGRIIYKGQTKPNTGLPGKIKGYSKKRVFKSPDNGKFTSPRKIGDEISVGEIFGYVGDMVIESKINGVIRGLLKSGIKVKEGVKLGDVDPRSIKDNCYTISDKARAIGGAVVTSILSLSRG
ncbi:selenium-dependent molybdenum cofactor biosynthesis protein YqeB [Selenihalanaerobacter shriftii]|uniref:Xanthine dehydrogenase accessory factor n=1 Tax=Selenihalanaerobacter shriftii TaxID=142842 RepID=A0A1T4JTH9_9FIRM|nr:selenium-dependent molybdenum cofactor biosynthesis protein YqeB [Selenihalanaerobacter shriftii]SJZ33414.1 xanthine dehydrogenase accessory factor [Selenihalanaerobacter shriftii]